MDADGHPVTAHYSSTDAAVFLVRYDTATPAGVENGNAAVMLRIGGDSLIIDHVDADELRALAHDAAALADTIDAAIDNLTAAMIRGRA